MSLSIGLSVFARDLDKTYTKAEFRLSGHRLTAYIADSDQKREEGLMYIEKLSRDEGMLFVFERESVLTFWMKNTLIPLSIGFFDHEGKLIDIKEMSVAASMLSDHLPTYQSRGPAVFALEMNKNWFTRNKIKLGARLHLQGSTRSQLLKIKLDRSIKPAPGQ
jgi:uncharacterized membrane protein (UPF0127 family)